MQMGSPIESSFVDASGDPGSIQVQGRKSMNMGIPRTELQKCELRAYASGFRPGTMSLIDLIPSGNNVDVGAIVIQRVGKAEGATLNAAAYRAPDKARKAYEKGLSAAQKNNLPDARKHFEQAVAIYPGYTSGWYQLGSVLQKQAQNDSARAAYLRATNLDTKFPAPFVGLASLAFESQNWLEVIRYTNHVIELDPWNHTNLTAYVVDFDPLKSAQAYYLNAAANYMLEKFDDAEKSVSTALHLDLLTRFPQAHLLMAQIYTQKQDYPGAISELETYLQLVPGTPPDAQARQQLAELQRLNSKVHTDQKSDRN